jgi:hypothetical protein
LAEVRTRFFDEAILGMGFLRQFGGAYSAGRSKGQMTY